ncbi:MAG: hypothetical protein U0105_10985 [Candidatus Obscuribacterales bacterium]
MTAIFVVLTAAIFYVYSHELDPPATDYNIGENGLWLGSKWYHGKVTEKDIESMAGLLKEHQIRYAYFHCRDITATGEQRFPPTDAARHLIDALHRLCPNVKVIAWVGAVNIHTGGEVDLSKTAVRERMVAAAEQLTKGVGFDGIQWDFEMTFDGDQHYLELLRATRAKIPTGSNLGADAHFFWSSSYIKQVAAEVDQLPVMAYDTVAFLPQNYLGTMRETVINFSKAAAEANPRCRVLIGVPTYEEFSFVHFYSETLNIALMGVKEGLASPACKRESIAGIAPYPSTPQTTPSGNYTIATGSARIRNPNKKSAHRRSFQPG